MRIVQPSAFVAMAVIALIGSARAQEVGPLTIAKQGYFFVGGKYVDTAAGPVTTNQAYVEFHERRQFYRNV